MKRRTASLAVKYLGLSLLALFMLYPLFWMVGASFKTNEEFFTNPGVFPLRPVFDGFADGWRGSGQFTFTRFFANTVALVIPTVFFTLASSVLVGYGFARFDFPLKKPLFSMMIATLMLPGTVVVIPRYILFKNLGWLDTYWPFIAPSILGVNAFFNFMMVQFFRGLPRELDESAILDGCGSFTTLTRILLPLCKPAIFSVVIFQFLWTWNDFFNSLLFINSVKKYTLALGLRMAIDISAQVNWNQVMAMSVVTLIPPVILFFAAQKYFVEGIATTGLKG